MELSAGLFCLAIIPIGIGIFFLARYFKAGKKKGQAIVSAEPSRTSRNGWTSWIPLIVIAFILALWSVTSAVFLLLIVWILRLDPKSELSYAVTEAEKKICESNYKWLRNSTFITLPVFFVALFLDTPPAIAALIPFVFHISLIQRLKTKSLYVYRHTQQSLLLLLLRAASAGILFSLFYLDEGLWPFVIVNGSFWLLGTNWEVSQVTRNECWLMKRKGEIFIRPKSVELANPVQGQAYLDRSWKAIDSKQNLQTVNNALSAFRQGDTKTRQEAVEILNALGEVEKF